MKSSLWSICYAMPPGVGLTSPQVGEPFLFIWRCFLLPSHAPFHTDAVVVGLHWWFHPLPIPVPKPFPKNFVVPPILGRVICPAHCLWVQPRVLHVDKCVENRGLKRCLQHFHLLFCSSAFTIRTCPNKSTGGWDTEQKSQVFHVSPAIPVQQTDIAGNSQKWREPSQDQQSCQPTCHWLQMHEWA